MYIYGYSVPAVSGSNIEIEIKLRSSRNQSSSLGVGDPLAMFND